MTNEGMEKYHDVYVNDMMPNDFIQTLSKTDPYVILMFINNGSFKLYEILKNLYFGAHPYFSDHTHTHVVTKINGEFYDIIGNVTKLYEHTVEFLSTDDIKRLSQYKFHGKVLVERKNQSYNDDKMDSGKAC